MRLQPAVLVDGIIYDAPVVAAAVDDVFINFPNGNPNYGLVHDQVVAIDPANRTVTLSLITVIALVSRSSTSHRVQ